ncbi:PREDICTED: signal transducer and activator of transcription 2 [Calidris pugnax]|uniref:signal transducer and activator of transcription 2 n=1 Tax=Calidris pugnax TaxID=198806 RepID=UPI00071C5746|nr:PREDICTED: signal transducer and activator of transcription 2 [Calidris pugnax]
MALSRSPHPAPGPAPPVPPLSPPPRDVISGKRATPLEAGARGRGGVASKPPSANGRADPGRGVASAPSCPGSGGGPGRRGWRGAGGSVPCRAVPVLSPRCRRRQAAEPLSSHARMLFHSLLALLDNHLGSLGVGDEDFMLKHNLRKARRDLQAEFEECPERFANLVDNLLQEERRILRMGQAGAQVGWGGVCVSSPPNPTTPSPRDPPVADGVMNFTS